MRQVSTSEENKYRYKVWRIVKSMFSNVNLFEQTIFFIEGEEISTEDEAVPECLSTYSVTITDSLSYFWILLTMSATPQVWLIG